MRAYETFIKWDMKKWEGLIYQPCEWTALCIHYPNPLLYLCVKKLWIKCVEFEKASGEKEYGHPQVLFIIENNLKTPEGRAIHVYWK